jgi:GT2 family glycosyltransferase
MNMHKLSVVAIVVTYGDRAELCLRIINAAIDNGVSHIIVVDNGSPEENAVKLQQAASCNSQIDLLRQDQNFGSAGGIARGLLHAISLEADDIWILDDDNLPKHDCLKSLIDARTALRSTFKEPVLFCYRGSTRSDDWLAVAHGKVKQYRRNAFCAFSVSARLAGKIRPPRANAVVSYPLIRTYFGPYGGMFARRQTFEQLGTPREDYFLYADDHEYCSRMERLGIDQFLVHNAQIDDLDISFSGSTGLLDPAASGFKIYYQIRNHTHLGMRNINCRFCYEFNKVTFLLIQIVLARRSALRYPRLVLKRLRLILNAISDGENNRLGRQEGIQ